MTVNKKICQYQQEAKRRKKIYKLPDALAADLMTDNCYYCGESPKPLNGIDRVDNEVGYLPNNVVTACKYCNLAKAKYSKEEFEGWLSRAAKHLTARA